MLAYCQIGFAKNIKEGQKIEVWLNDTQLKIKKDDGGQYLTPMAQRYAKCWYLKPFEVQVGDTILIRCQTGLRGLGPDEKRTFDAVFTAANTENIEEKVPCVGFGKDFPLLKGPFNKVSFVTAEDLRLAKANGMLNDHESTPCDGEIESPSL